MGGGKQVAEEQMPYPSPGNQANKILQADGEIFIREERLAGARKRL